MLWGLAGASIGTPYDYCPAAGALKTEYVEAGAREREKVTGEYRKLFRLYVGGDAGVGAAVSASDILIVGERW